MNQIERMTRSKVSSRLLAFLALVSLAGSVGAAEVTSPDGRIAVEVDADDAGLFYRVRMGGAEVLERSPLGLVTSIGGFSSGLRHEGVETGKIDEHYRLPHGKVSEVHYVANTLTTTFAGEGGGRISVVFQVSDRDVAFRYHLTSERERRVVVEKERTGFNLPGAATAFVTQQVAWGGGFAKTKPSYEEGYMMDVPVGTKSRPGLGFTFPALFRLGEQGWMLISETGVTSRYVGSRLGDPDDEGIYPLAFPDERENAGVGDATVSSSLPMTTPWRTITVGESLGPIVETTVSTDVVKPLYEPAEDYLPGRATWSWILWQDGSMNERDQRAYIDLAAKLGYEYILIDALWDRNIGREKMAEMVKDAASKGVGVFLWYNSNGSWNDAPQSPRDRMDTAPARQNEMAWLQSIGVKGLKIDFFGGDKQVTMKLYEDILTDGSRYGLIFNFHGATLPRGWQRMYPNFMTSEAVTASENLIFSQGFADREAFHSTVYPFVRNPVAPMDYGPVLLNRRFSRNPDRGNTRRTTDAFQLATAVTFQSPLQHFGLTPNNLDEQPEFVLDFLRRVPAAWDETRFVQGYPGKLFAVARRSGDDWYLAATNGQADARELEVTLPWLEGKSFIMIHDLPDGTAGRHRVTVGPDGGLTIPLGANGGAVLHP